MKEKIYINLKRSIVSFIVALIVFITFININGCAIRPAYPEFRSRCSQNTVLAITSVKGMFPTRVLYGKIKGSEDKWHVYGQIYFNGERINLGVPVWATVKSGVKEHELEKPIVFTGKQYMDRVAKRLRNKEY